MQEQTCFIIMPITDPDGYEKGHFGRVYEYIIKPACSLTNLLPIRADEVQVTNYIVIDILRKILEADMVICDLSSRNPNVLYELGIRQAFNLPVTLIRDSKTPRIFDIQGLRDIEYDEALRIDKTNTIVNNLANTLRNTGKLAPGEVNSVIQLLGLKPATVPSLEVSNDTSLLLSAISDLGKRLSHLEETVIYPIYSREFYFPSRFELPIETKPVKILDKNGVEIKRGTIVSHSEHGEGIVYSIANKAAFAKFPDGQHIMFTVDAAAEELESI